MAGRIRSLKPELLDDAKAGRLSDGAWRLWISSFLLADDHGNLRADPQQLAGQVFWGSPRTAANVGELLRELAEGRLLFLYEVNGQEYAHIPGWAKHQRVDNAGKPRCPKPDEGVEVRRESPRVSANVGDLPPDHRPPTTDQDHRKASEVSPRPVPPPEAVRVAERIAQHVAGRDPRAKGLQPARRDRTIATWADAIRLLHKDGRTWPEIDRVWAWASRHSFWAGNILSGPTLRKQFEKLTQQMAPSPNGYNGRPATGDDEDPILNRVRP